MSAIIIPFPVRERVAKQGCMTPARRAELLKSMIENSPPNMRRRPVTRAELVALIAERIDQAIAAERGN